MLDRLVVDEAITRACRRRAPDLDGDQKMSRSTNYVAARRTQPGRSGQSLRHGRGTAVKGWRNDNTVGSIVLHLPLRL